MEIQDIKDRVKLIRGKRFDDEAAHYDEDRLHRDVLHEIAEGHSDPREMAKEALGTVQIKFLRHCV